MLELAFFLTPLFFYTKEKTRENRAFTRFDFILSELYFRLRVATLKKAGIEKIGIKD